MWSSFFNSIITNINTKWNTKLFNINNYTTDIASGNGKSSQFVCGYLSTIFASAVDGVIFGSKYNKNDYIIYKNTISINTNNNKIIY